MQISKAVKSLEALANPSRLKVFRMLVAQGEAGLPAGEIARALAIPPATLSFHLGHLTQAGLMESRRSGRSIIYSLRVCGVRELLAFLTEDCCQGRPELCTSEAGDAKRCAKDCSHPAPRTRKPASRPRT